VHSIQKIVGRHRRRLVGPSAVGVRPLLAVVTLGLLMNVATACSSSSGASSGADREEQGTATTAPTLAPPADSSSLREFLAKEGAPLILFEQATRSLGSGKRPSTSACLKLRSAVFQDADKTKSLQELIAQVPDIGLRNLLQQNLQDKLIIVGGCGAARIPDAKIAEVQRTTSQIAKTLSTLEKGR
jgi:hypothetical protein